MHVENAQQGSLMVYLHENSDQSVPKEKRGQFQSQTLDAEECIVDNDYQKVESDQPECETHVVHKHRCVIVIKSEVFVEDFLMIKIEQLVVDHCPSLSSFDKRFGPQNRLQMSVVRFAHRTKVRLEPAHDVDGFVIAQMYGLLMNKASWNNRILDFLPSA